MDTVSRRELSDKQLDCGRNLAQPVSVFRPVFLNICETAAR